MPKRRASGLDRFYQEWHIKRTQTAVGAAPGSGTGDEEFTIPCPRPLSDPSSGYWAIEIHSIEYVTSVNEVIHATNASQFVCQWALTTSPRTGKVPFITGPGDADNIWFNKKWVRREGADEHGAIFISEQTRLDNLARYTDDKGFGKIIVGDNIYLQVATSCLIGGFGAPSTIEMAIEYTWTTVTCPEMVQELASQLQVS